MRHSCEGFLDFGDPLGQTLNGTVNPVKALADAIKALVDAIQALVDPVQSLVHTVKALGQSLEGLVDPVKALLEATGLIPDQLFDAVKAFVGGQTRELPCGRISSISILHCISSNTLTTSAAGSGAQVIWRPITKWSAPSRMASAGVATRF